MIRRILALVKKEFLHLKGDWWLPALMLFGGALELLAIGWATSRPITNLPMAIWDMDRTAASRDLVVSLENTGVFSMTEPAGGGVRERSTRRSLFPMVFPMKSRLSGVIQYCR